MSNGDGVESARRGKVSDMDSNELADLIASAIDKRLDERLPRQHESDSDDDQPKQPFPSYEKLTFSKKGVGLQYEANESYYHGIDKAVKLLEGGKPVAKALEQLQKTKTRIAGRQKFLRVAEKHGFDVAELYEGEEIADGLDDEKRLRKAVKEAAAQKGKRPAASSARGEPPAKQPFRAGRRADYSGRGGDFPIHGGARRSPPRPSAEFVNRTQNGGRRATAAGANEGCYRCGDPGHFSRNCRK